MNLKNILCVVLILISGQTFAQEKTPKGTDDKKAAFAKAVDYANSRTVYEYLSSYAESARSSKEEKQLFNKIKKQLDVVNIDKSLHSDSLSALLVSNNFRSTNDKFAKVIAELKKAHKSSFTKETALATIMDGIFASKELDLTNIDTGSLKDHLNGPISAYFNSKFTTSPTAQIEQQIAEFSVQQSLWGWILSSFSFISLALLVTSFFWQKKLHQQLISLQEIERKDTAVQQPFGSLNDVVADAQHKRHEEKNLANNFEQTTQSDQNVSLQNETFEVYPTAENVNATHQDLIPVAHQSNVLYAAIPSKDNFFNETGISDQIIAGKSYYKFTINARDRKKATFEFLGDNERAVKDATNAPEKILKPACSIQNALNQHAKTIRTIKPGTVVKKEDKWEIDTLAEIEYE